MSAGRTILYEFGDMLARLYGSEPSSRVHNVSGGLSEAVGGAALPVALPGAILIEPQRAKGQDGLGAFSGPELVGALHPFVEAFHAGFGIPGTDGPAPGPVFRVFHVVLVLLEVPQIPPQNP